MGDPQTNPLSGYRIKTASDPNPMGDPHQKVSRDTISCVRFLVVLNEGMVKQPQIVATIPAINLIYKILSYKQTN